VLENAMIGAFRREARPDRARAVAERALAVAGLGELARRPAGGLTVPERKRLELARCLATQPTLLLLDEVFAGLNAAETDRLIGLVREIHASGVDVLLIEHVMRVVVNLSHRVVVLNYGRKLAEGTPEEVTRDAAVIEAYLGEEYA
jgi:branched-chain amino acid transport system ATP-binding protein